MIIPAHSLGKNCNSTYAFVVDDYGTEIAITGEDLVQFDELWAYVYGDGYFSPEGYVFLCELEENWEDRIVKKVGESR